MKDSVNKNSHPAAGGKKPETGKMDALRDNAGAEATAEVDPKLARKEAVNDMKRSHIMDAAFRVIARDGYANARFEDIAEEAGFSRAAIYHYFPDKEALFIHITIREQRAMHEKYLEIVERNLPFLDTLKEFALVFYDRFLGDKSLCGGSYSAVASPISVMSSFITSMSKHEELMNTSIACKMETFMLMTQVIAKAKESGILTIPVDNEILCTLISSFFQQLMMTKLYERWQEANEGGPDKTPGMAPFIPTVFKGDFNKMVDTLFVFFKPWINEPK
ncbi:MAG: TetR/AcrR family transcriptional regulator [Chitinispirillales bacterium]|nr:TetR/AcrR family transcriptional regulator [Chitinispirillales bacterium]